MLVGKATKASDILPVDEKKAMRAGFKFGISTDTQDITGEVLTNSNISISLERLENAAESFCGRYIAGSADVFSSFCRWEKDFMSLLVKAKQLSVSQDKEKVNYIKINSYDPLTREGVMSVSVSKRVLMSGP